MTKRKVSRFPELEKRGLSPFSGGSSGGFTLVEMLVALAIFGMITAAGVTLLTLTARTQATADRLLDEVGELRRAGALIAADLGQAVRRRHRDRDGMAQRAFAGSGGGEGELLLFVRSGRDSGDGPTLQRVGYRLREGRFERLGHARVDGAGGEPVAIALLDGVRLLRLRYRDDEGAWLERWQPTDESRLPVAVELVTDSERHGMVRQLFAVGTGGR